MPASYDAQVWLDLIPSNPKRLKMSTELAKIDPGTMLERVVVHGDLSKLTPGDRAAYYGQVCNSLGLNPLTRPFEYLTLNGKQILYARRDCTDQLRKIHEVSVTIQAREHIGDLLVVTARAMLPNGRKDESTGAVAVGNLKGEALANAMMKAETKAKRRVTLSICGLAVLDESEVEGAKATDRNGDVSAHAYPDEDPQAPAKASDEYDRVIAALAAIEKRIQEPSTIVYSDVLTLREQLGSKAKPSALGKQLSALYNGDSIAPDQRKELGRIWNRLDRQITKLEGTIQPPPVEASFEDADERQPVEEG